MRASNLSLERSGFRRGLLRGLFRLGRELCLEPFGDAAFQGGGPETLTDELCGDVRARKLVGIRVVHHDLTVARESGGGSLAGPSHRAGKANGTVLVRILEASV